MSERYYLLTDKDRELIQHLLRGKDQSLGNTSGRQTPNEDTVTAPEVYIGFPDDAGITAGSGSVPGSGLCTIYRLLSGTLTDTGLTRSVYNLGDEITDGYCSIGRDKYGAWWVLQSAGSAPSPSCRTMLVGKAADSVLTAVIPPGVGKCSNISPTTIYLAYDATITPPYIGYSGGWVSTPFTTALGATTATVYLDDRGDPATLLSADGGSAGTLTRPMTFRGCDSLGRMRFTMFDCIWCNGTWVGPCGTNEFELLVSCGVSVCSPKKPVPALLHLDLTLDDGSPPDEHVTGTLTFGYVVPGFESVVGSRPGVAFWGFGEAIHLGLPGSYYVLSDLPWNGFCMRLEHWTLGTGDDDVPVLDWIAGVGADADFPWPGNFTGGLFSSSLSITAGTVDGSYDPCGTPPSPPPPTYYDCIDGVCVEVGYTTAYPNDPTCGGTCDPGHFWCVVVTLSRYPLGTCPPVGAVFCKDDRDADFAGGIVVCGPSPGTRYSFVVVSGPYVICPESC